MREYRYVWFCVVLLLLALTVGTIAGGRLSGLGSLNLGGAAITPPTNMSVSSGITGGSGLAKNGFGLATGANAPPLVGEYIPPGPPKLSADLLLYLVIFAAIAAGIAFLLRSPAETGVYDFASAINQLDKQRSLMAGTWSQKLRNAALIRYYTIMRKTCAQIGLVDELSETPLEYLSRVATALKINQSDAAGFAAAFDRARYGSELSEDEAQSAANSMARFVDGLKERLLRG